jgi:hypothetical protein
MRFRLPKPIRDWIRAKNLPNEEFYWVSECCGAERWMETDICSDCKEHAEFMEVNY